MNIFCWVGKCQQFWEFKWIPLFLGYFKGIPVSFSNLKFFPDSLQEESTWDGQTQWFRAEEGCWQCLMESCCWCWYDIITKWRIFACWWADPSHNGYSCTVNRNLRFIYCSYNTLQARIGLYRAAGGSLNAKCVSQFFLVLKIAWVRSVPRKQWPAPCQGTDRFGRVTWKFGWYFSLATLGGLKTGARAKEGENALGNPDWTDPAWACLEPLAEFCIFFRSRVNSFLVSVHAVSEVLGVQWGKQNNRDLEEQKPSSFPTKLWMKTGWRIRSPRTEVLLDCHSVAC